MEINTATQRSGIVTPPVNSYLLSSIEQPPLRPETEYGCVDWYAYAPKDEARKDWFDSDSGLAVGAA